MFAECVLPEHPVVPPHAAEKGPLGMSQLLGLVRQVAEGGTEKLVEVAKGNGTVVLPAEVEISEEPVDGLSIAHRSLTLRDAQASAGGLHELPALREISKEMRRRAI